MTKAKFLTDENVSPMLVHAIREKGYDVKDVKEENLFGLSDDKILVLARKTNRSIITYDSDFANLLNYPLQSHKGVILLRYSNIKPDVLLKKFLPLLDALVKKGLISKLIIISNDFVEIIGK